MQYELLNINGEVKDDDDLKKYFKFGADSSQWSGTPPAKRSSCSSRKYWYSIPVSEKPNISCNYMVGSLMKFYLGEIFAINNFHSIYLDESNEAKTYCCILNSTLSQLLLNVLGRGNMGDGVMKVEKYEVEQLKLIRFKKDLIEEKVMDDFISRNQKSIFEEIGLDENLTIRNQEPNPLFDRGMIDNVIFDELGLTEVERKEVYWSVAELVKQRLDKAASR